MQYSHTPALKTYRVTGGRNTPSPQRKKYHQNSGTAQPGSQEPSSSPGVYRK